MELFIKRFIDLLDETAPVSMVHTIVEQPLGAIANDNYVRIHSRLDLVDESSPFVEIELYPYDYHNIDVLYAYTYPKEGIITKEEQFVEEIKQESVRAEKIIPVGKEEEYSYEVFYEEEVKVPENKSEVDEVIVSIVNRVKEWLTKSGYETEDGE